MANGIIFPKSSPDLSSFACHLRSTNMRARQGEIPTLSCEIHKCAAHERAGLLFFQAWNLLSVVDAVKARYDQVGGEVHDHEEY